MDRHHRIGYRGARSHAATVLVAVTGTLPLPLPPSDRVVLERIRDGEAVTYEAGARALAKGWARRSKGALILSDAGVAALRDDDDARAASRSARARPSRRRSD